MNTNQEHRVKNRVNRGLILMYGPVVRSQEALELKRLGLCARQTWRILILGEAAA
jgi:hypothetical protein